MLALIDYDIICYSCGFAVQKTYYDVYLGELLVQSFLKKREAKQWIGEEDGYSIVPRVEVEPVENALQAAKEKVASIVKRVGATDYIGLLTGEGNFREEVAVTRPYKGNRKQVKPVHYEALREYLLTHQNGVLVEGMEADDAMAVKQMAMFQDEKYNMHTVICTRDKDLDQIPGWHYNWFTDKKYWVDALEGIVWFYKQMLVGDSVDNIIGVYGVGPKTADKLLAPCKSEQELFTVVWREYKNENGPRAKEVMQEMADLLYIRKHPTDRWNIEDYQSYIEQSDKAEGACVAV